MTGQLYIPRCCFPFPSWFCNSFLNFLFLIFYLSLPSWLCKLVHVLFSLIIALLDPIHNTWPFCLTKVIALEKGIDRKCFMIRWNIVIVGVETLDVMRYLWASAAKESNQPIYLGEDGLPTFEILEINNIENTERVFV